ncbi:MAG: ribosomal protein S18-alanine N-acetyltransferase [Candidatus Aminicenantes bacterium]|nr:ribosomal protein S18-alanine N-acetyltransferase [Candidatus Aminicenantes bacterium]
MEWKKGSIQKMDTNDLDEVLSIEISDSLTPWSKNMFVEEMRNPFAYCFVMKMEEGSKQPVIGFICFRNVAEESELLNICVHRAYRQLGFGKQLMEFYIDFSYRRGSKTFYLEVRSSNHTAIHLYQLFSYQSSGIRKKFYQGKFDALLMMKTV